MKNILKSFLTICLVLTLSFTCFNSKSYALNDNVTIEESEAYFKYLLEKIMDDYYGKGYENLSIKTLSEAAFKGMFSILDDYSTYYTKEEYKAYEENNSGVKYGMGATVQKYESGGAIIIDIASESSAEKAGMMVNDIIIRVDDLDVTNMTLDEIVSHVTGDEGTHVKITVNRAGNILSFDIVRCEVKDDPVSFSLLSEITGVETDNDTLYIYLEKFTEIAYEGMYEAFEKYPDINKVILDLRDNPGGYTEQALKICSYFIDKGDEILTLKDKEGNDATYSSKSDKNIDDIVVIINNNSASASEVTTGCLRDNNRAIVVGENSFGKNVSQTIYDMKDIQFKLTEEVYFTPSGKSVLGTGITPDIIVETPNYIYDVKYKYYGGEKSNDILCAKSMLKFLGYNVTDFTDTFDQSTIALVSQFQGDNGLGTYGALDYTTQRKLNEVASKKNNETDIQFDKAVEVIRDFDTYKNKFLNK